MRAFLSALAILLLGCDGCRDRHGVAPVNYEDVQDALIETNRQRLKSEVSAIKIYIQDKQWPMTETATGLHYWIYRMGSGTPATPDRVAVVAFEVALLGGKVCYDADSLHPARFLIGKDYVETGLHEAILLMREGDRAKLIIPSHLAFGFTGDSDCIPQESTLIYDLHLIAIE